MLAIETFDARRGGNVLYKALTHPLAAEAIAVMAAEMAAGSVAVFDPAGFAPALFALHPEMPAPCDYYVQDCAALGTELAGIAARPVTCLAESRAAFLLIAGFDSDRLVTRYRHLIPAGMIILSLDRARLPYALLTNPRHVLDRFNYATNFAFFRDADRLSTRLTSANYWYGYGAGTVKLWLRLFDHTGAVLATWEQELPHNAASYVIDSQEIKARFSLPDFTGQLFMHAVGIAGHDVIKYALDIYGHDGDQSLSVTHDANAWPSDRYAGLPAPRDDERVYLWVQNSHAAPIPAGAMMLDRMGAENPAPILPEIAPFATLRVDVADILPGVSWPAQIELRSGRHVVRPRYEVVRTGRTRIAHVNVERADLAPDPAIRNLPATMGRGFLLPFPVLDPENFRTIVQPNPMSERAASLPLRLDVFAADGTQAAQHFLGNLPRNHNVAFDLADLSVPGGHAELVYDFSEGGEADGWPHGLFRYENRLTSHAAETSFGGHVFNTAMTWRDEPQSYNGPPPGLSTRLFLKLGFAEQTSFCVLIYPASLAWHPYSTTTLHLIGSDGEALDDHPLRIACSGSHLIEPQLIFSAKQIKQAGPRGYVLIRDVTCRLFGYHGLRGANGAFSLDHMFGF
jgi:hypothetical protein